MSDRASPPRYRFGVFEADASTGELRKQGIRIKLNAQPFQVLLMLLARPGEVLTREEISQAIWSDGTFVDYEHGLNSAVNRIREALGDSAGSPRFVETLARRGYRFVAPVERISPEPAQQNTSQPSSPGITEDNSEVFQEENFVGLLPTSAELPDPPHNIVRLFFLLLQLMYVAFYVGSLANLSEIQDLLSPLPAANSIYYALIGTAVILIAVRAYLISAIALRAPRMRGKFLKLWPYLLLADVLWALSPLLLLHHINTGMALACMALLAYSPFAQRSLILMGAARDEGSTAA
ncbi:MAG TPA: winged helix-turn-helix domain-containing protein [Terracidiphilus sp.]|nr:winged helix-turn-helix domain-containing protein [Terracidiphilus sp.]